MDKQCPRCGAYRFDRAHSNMAQVKLKEESELWGARGPCGPHSNPGLHLLHIKKEPEEQLQELPVVPVCVKTEDDEDKSSVLHQRAPDKNREETNGWECGAEAGCSSDPLTQFHSDSEEHTDSSEDTDHSEDYSQEQAQAKRSYAMVPPDAAVSDKMPYSCSECGKKFRWKSQLKYHRFTHSGEKPHKCLECGKSFTSESHLKRHMVVHSGEKPHSCPVCEKNPLICSLCGKSFARKANVKAHMLVHTKEQPHKCADCGECYKHKASLAQHLKRCHPDCPVCQKHFPNKIQLGEHLNSHVEDGTMDQRLLERHLSEETPLKCSMCDKCFGNKHHLSRHLRDRHLICSSCKINFPDKIKLIEHLKSHVEDGTLNQSVLKQYMKLYKCSQCGKEFNKKSNLQSHMFVHTEEKPFQCPLCDKGFKTLSKVDVHQKRVHRMCPVCGELLLNNFKLIGHLRTHVEDGTLDQTFRRIR